MNSTKPRQPQSRLTPDQTRKLGELATAERELARLAIEHSEVLHRPGRRDDLARRGRPPSQRRRRLARQTRHGSSGPTRPSSSPSPGLKACWKPSPKLPPKPAQKPPGGGGARRPEWPAASANVRALGSENAPHAPGRPERANPRLPGATSRPGGKLPTPATEAALNREAQELAAEQRRLAGLVQEMLSRNNKQEKE